MKVSLPPDTILFPLPCVLLTAGAGEEANIITLAWVGVACSDPPMVGAGIRPSRLSHGLVSGSGQFALNIPTAAMLDKVDFCGTVSGRKVNKFRAAGLTPVPALEISAPLIAECPVNIECLVRHTLRIGSHDFFIGEVVRVHADEGLVRGGKRLDVGGADPLAYFPGANEYRRSGAVVGKYGFTGGKLGG
jgi:flavin reductase (DIM6/NTAB) family NADH-FMN oxidoreductase RutF